MASAPPDVVGLTRKLLARTETVVNGVIDNVFDRFAIALVRRRPDAVVVVPADDFYAYRETIEVLEDPDAMDDLKVSAQEADEEAEPWEGVKRGLGRA